MYYEAEADQRFEASRVRADKAEFPAPTPGAVAPSDRVVVPEPPPIPLP